MFHKDLWGFRKQGVARGWLIGMLVATSPLFGLHLLMGGLLSLWCRANLLVVLGLTLAINPLTAGFFYSFAFLVGCQILGREASEYHWNNAPIWHAGEPLFVGCGLIGCVAGLAGFAIMHLLWRERPKTREAVA